MIKIYLVDGGVWGLCCSFNSWGCSESDDRRMSISRNTIQIQRWDLYVITFDWFQYWRSGNIHLSNYHIHTANTSTFNLIFLLWYVFFFCSLSISLSHSLSKKILLRFLFIFIFSLLHLLDSLSSSIIWIGSKTSKSRIALTTYSYLHSLPSLYWNPLLFELEFPWIQSIARNSRWESH